MRETRKLKVGLAGVMSTPFRGDKESHFVKSARTLEKLADELHFELHVAANGLYSPQDAQAAANEFTAWGADFILLQASSFGPGGVVYPIAALDVFLGIWAVPEGDPDPDGGLPLNSFTAANMLNSILGTSLKGYTRPVKWFYGYPENDLFYERLAVTVRALTALVNLRGARIGLIGGVAPGFDNLVCDEEIIHQRLGARVAHLEFDEVIQRARGQSETQVKAAAAEIRDGAASFDGTQEEALSKSGRVYLTYQQMAEEHGLDALAISCWPRFQSDYGLAVCSVMGHLNSGGMIAACEGDVASAVSMLALKYMSGGEVVTLMDLSALDESDESVLLWHCGAAPADLADENGARLRPLWLFDQPGGERIGLHNDLVLRPGQATVMGFATGFDRILVFDGRFDNRKASYGGSRGWLTSLCLNGDPVRVRDLVQTLMACKFQHHYPLAYGDYVYEALELAAWLGVKPIGSELYVPYLRA